MKNDVCARVFDDVGFRTRPVWMIIWDKVF